MGFLRRLLGRNTDGHRTDDGSTGADEPRQAGETDGDDHLVVAWVRLADPDFDDEREQARLFTLEDRIMRTLFDAGAGDLDTNDLVPGYFCMRLMGPDGDRIVSLVSPLLEGCPAGSYLAVRRGPRGTSEERVELR